MVYNINVEAYLVKKRQKITKEIELQLCKSYLATKSIRHLEICFNLGRKTIKNVLTKNGIEVETKRHGWKHT